MLRSASVTALLSLAPLSSWSLLVACGSGSHPGQQVGVQIQQERTDEAFAESYYVADLNCQAAPQPLTLGSVTLRRWEGGRGVDAAVNLGDVHSGDSVVSPLISASFYNLYQSTTCSASSDPSSCGAPKIINEPQSLRICQPQGSYPRISVEAITLTSMNHLDIAYRYYKALAGHRDNLAQTQLIVLPTVETTYSQSSRRTVQTDNLAYVPDFGGDPAFVIFPKGQKANAKGLWKDLNLWELPWALAHEFGHHVFRTHTGISSLGDSASTGKSATMTGLPFHDYAVSDVPAPTGLGLTGREITSNDHWNAVNEGYADLFSFYVYGRQPDLNLNVDCFAGNRDVGQATFINGQAKVLSDSVLTVFQAPKMPPSSDCSTPNFQDIHVIGAIVAHGVDQIFTAVNGGATAPDAAAKNASLLLKWAERIRQTVDAVGRNNMTVGLMVRDAMRVAANNGNLPKAVCDSAAQLFPALSQTLSAADRGFSCN